MAGLAIDAAPDAGTLTGEEIIPVLKGGEPARTTLGSVISGLIPASQKGAPNGVVPLDSSGFISPIYFGLLSPTEDIDRPDSSGEGVGGFTPPAPDFAALLEDGTYTPALAGVNNITTVSTSAPFSYARNGLFVTIAGVLAVDAAAASTLTKIWITTPIASAFTDRGNAGGIAVLFDGGPAGAIYATPVASPPRLELSYTTGASHDPQWMSIHASYRIL